MKISIIVPVYNVQEYLAECVQSILKQTFSDFELLIIDDGSTDQSGKIADKLALNDSRIQVFHKQNGGLSDARNYGIDRVQGEYITFIDSDDYIAPIYLESLLELLINYNADVSCVSQFETTKRSTNSDSNAEIVTGKYTGIEAITDSLLRNNLGISACGKLFRGTLFKGIRFPKGELYEDLLTLPYVFEKCKTVAYSNAKLYFYYQRPGSITNTRISDRHMRFFDNTIQLMEKFDHYGKETHEAFLARFVGDSINRAEILLFCPDYSDRIKCVKKYMGKYWKEAQGVSFIPRTTKIQVAVLQRSTVAYYILFKPYKTIKKWLKGTSLVG